MSEEKTNENTSIQEVEVDDQTLNELLGMPGAESVMVPSTEKKKPSIFTSTKVDTSFLEKPDLEESKDSTEESTDTKTPDKNQSSDDVLKETLNEINDLIDEENSPSGNGRPKVDKSGLIETVNKLIEKGKLFAFDDDKPLDKYSAQDFLELIEANIEEKERTVREEVPMEFFDSLPNELKAAAKYVADGGQNLKGLFRHLAQAEEIKDLDVEDSNDQEVIVRNYLLATRFGTPEEIEEEIDEWKDRGDLEAKATKFKPKLDAMQEQIVAQKLQEQEHVRKSQEVAAKNYADSIYKTLETGELNSLKLDKKTQGLLFTGLVQPNYPSASGRPTNLLGHLLEKYQYGTQTSKPRHDLIAEALWLLTDSEGYKAKVREDVTKQTTEKTVRLLKTEQANRNASTTQMEDEKDDSSRPVKKISRNNNSGGFFKR